MLPEKWMRLIFPARISLRFLHAGKETSNLDGFAKNRPDLRIAGEAGVPSPQAKGKDIPLPHLVRRGPLKKPRPTYIPGMLLLGRDNQGLFLKRPPHRLRGGVQEEDPLQ